MKVLSTKIQIVKYMYTVYTYKKKVETAAAVKFFVKSLSSYHYHQ